MTRELFTKKFSNLRLDNHLLNVEQRNFITSIGVTLDGEEARQLERATVAQSQCEMWFTERKKRLIASNFGRVVKLHSREYPGDLLNMLFKTQSVGSTPPQWGLQKEKLALDEYKRRANMGNNIEDVGLFVNPKWPWLGASPDGIVSKNGVETFVEVKCPYHQRFQTIREACCDD